MTWGVTDRVARRRARTRARKRARRVVGVGRVGKRRWEGKGWWRRAVKMRWSER